jgi:hypothetical protein
MSQFQIIKIVKNRYIYFLYFLMNIGALCSQKIVKTTKLVLGPKNSHVNAKIDATYEKIDIIRFTATCSQGVRARVKTPYKLLTILVIKLFATCQTIRNAKKHQLGRRVILKLTRLMGTGCSCNCCCCCCHCCSC